MYDCMSFDHSFNRKNAHFHRTFVAEDICANMLINVRTVPFQAEMRRRQSDTDAAHKADMVAARALRQADKDDQARASTSSCRTTWPS